MKIHLSYGKSGLDVDFPDTGIDVIEPEFVEGLPDEVYALARSTSTPDRGIGSQRPGSSRRLRCHYFPRPDAANAK